MNTGIMMTNVYGPMYRPDTKFVSYDNVYLYCIYDSLVFSSYTYCTIIMFIFYLMYSFLLCNLLFVLAYRLI
jgi:hypothetical protein